MSRSHNDTPGRLNHTMLGAHYRLGNLTVIADCRICGRPAQTNGRVVVCAQCDLIERTPNIP